MATTTYGSLSAFQPAEEDWKAYRQRLDFYFAAKEIMDAAKGFLTCNLPCKLWYGYFQASMKPSGRWQARQLQCSKLRE